jgi:hypothetical protein
VNQSTGGLNRLTRRVPPFSCALEHDGTLVPECEGEELPSGVAMCWFFLAGRDRHDTCYLDGWNLELRLLHQPDVFTGGQFLVACVPSQQPRIDCPNLPH